MTIGNTAAAMIQRLYFYTYLYILYILEIKSYSINNVCPGGRGIKRVGHSSPSMKTYSIELSKTSLRKTKIDQFIASVGTNHHMSELGSIRDIFPEPIQKYILNKDLSRHIPDQESLMMSNEFIKEYFSVKMFKKSAVCVLLMIFGLFSGSFDVLANDKTESDMVIGHTSTDINIVKLNRNLLSGSPTSLSLSDAAVETSVTNNRVDEYEISFAGESIGLSISEVNNQGFPVLVVKAIKDEALQQNHPELREGAVITDIGSTPTAGLNLEKLSNLVKTNALPLTIKFRDPTR